MPRSSKKRPRPLAKLKNFPPGDLSKRNAVLVSMLSWRVIQARNLPRACIKSLVAHMKTPPESMRSAIQIIGPKTRIGVVKIPMQMLMLATMNDPSRKRDFQTFDEYHEFYKSVEPVKHHRSVWPIILSGKDWATETIIDGWHRFHSYYRRGVKTVTALWYADE